MTQQIIDSKLFGKQYYFVKGIGKNIIICIHGFAEDASIFDAVSKYLSSQYTILQINLPGCGNTFLNQTKITISELANYVHEIILDFKTNNSNMDTEKFILAGHSMGAYIALQFLKKYTNLCAGISLINSTLLADDIAKKENRLKAVALIEANPISGKQAFLNALIKNLYTTNFYSENKTIIAKHFAMANLWQNETIKAYYHAMMQRENAKNIVESAAVPLQFIFGALDTLVPEKSALEQATFAGVTQVHKIDKCAHMSIIEQPEMISQLLNNFTINCF